ncbi:cytochrome c550 [Halobacillus sp. Marseille-Q1614]|uniref:cytochrome c550 n=1 Tax=Halobacillus sp. Marseille-Q1614 TaxID=2709134 RepID=UPI0015709819|nr:cytochrome c [Halobacillus sp. Marseille-Q1614]
MKRNPVIPFALIAVLGILAMVIVSSVGINEREAIQNEENGEETEETAAAPEEMYQQSCSSCHGGDLEGANGPNLQEVGSKYEAEEIQEIIINGKGGGAMPAGLYTGDDAAKLAQWLAEEHQ